MLVHSALGKESPEFECRNASASSLSALTHGIGEGHFRATMADKNDKWPENVKGRFYVDEQCIDCDLCRETAPDFFQRNDDGGYSFVFKQPNPDSQAEIDLCMEALEGCPVEAIGDDGED